MKIEKIITLLVALMWSSGVFADISIQATYLDKNGVEVKTSEDFSGEAPLHVTLESITASLPTTAQVEWHITNSRNWHWAGPPITVTTCRCITST